MRSCGLAILVLLAVGTEACSVVSAQKPPAQAPTASATSARPVVEQLKERYAAGEPIMFMVGVEQDPGDLRLIPANLVNTFRVLFVRPDGSERVDQKGGPECGFCAYNNTPGDRGWFTGHSLGLEKPQLGRWQVTAEFAGRRTTPKSFTVEEVPFLKDIRTEFVFPSPIVVGSNAKLVVRNQSSEVIRFPVPGQNGTSVSVQLERGGGGGSAFFVQPTWLPPSDKPSVISLGGRMTLEFAQRYFTMATVLPNGTYELSVPIAQAILDANRTIVPGEYTVKLFTHLDLLPGESDGPWKDFWPIRVSVTSETRATWR